MVEHSLPFDNYYFIVNKIIINSIELNNRVLLLLNKIQ